MFWLPFRKKKIGLVLGGGIARGIAHIGVLKVIEQYKIPVDYIAATSSGSLIGAAYAAGLEISVIEQIALRIGWGRMFKLSLFKLGFLSNEVIEDLLIKYIGDVKFSELKTPFATVGTDIKTGQQVVMKKGRVAKAVSASSAFPGVFAPEDIQGKFVVDGGLSDNVPVDVVRKMGANFVIASDVVPACPVKYLPHDPFQAFGRSLDIVMHKLAVEQRKKADILIEPHLLDEDIWHLDLHKAQKMIAVGEAEAHKALRHLRRS
ncbi:MAG: patatin-like phospholipase family protein [bacterium]